MKYPMKDHFLVFRRKPYGIMEVVHELWEQSWEMDAETAGFIKALDGRTDPYHISSRMSTEEVDDLMNILASEGLLEDGGRITRIGIGTVLICLWKPRVTKGFRMAAAVWNTLLMILWLPIFILGIMVFFSGNRDGLLWGPEVFYGVLVWIAGIFLHEFSHASACIHFRGHFFELGIMSEFFLPGAYVILKYENVRHPFKRAQISAAGIESNFFLAGICLCLLNVRQFAPAALLAGALLNVVLAVFNCSLIESFDGMGICQELLGGEKFIEKAKKLIWDPEAKNILMHRGINGKATIAACYLILMLQILLPIVLIMNFAGLLALFVR